MAENLFTQKLAAFLHDPIDKPYVLLQGENHFERAKSLAGLLGISIDEEVQAFDHISAATERAFLPKGASKNEILQVKFLDDPCIKHPLSGKELEIVRNIRGLGKEKFKRITETSLKKMAGFMDQDEKTKYLYIWRNLLLFLEENSDDKSIRKICALAPADTRIPDHSIFEHLKISSACYNSAYVEHAGKYLLLNSCALFLFSIGPVQSFIQQARKTQDLYWSSFILSYLTWKAIEHMADNFGPDSIIYPDLHGQPFVDYWLEEKIGNHNVKNSKSSNIWIPTIPNRFLAIIPKRDKIDLETLGNRLEEIIKSEIKNIASSILREFKLQESQDFRSQIDNFLEIYWAAVPWFRDDSNGKQDWVIALEELELYISERFRLNLKSLLEYANDKSEYRPNTGSIYSLVFTFTEKLLGARKSLRDFSKFEPETGRKCSICGERNALFYRDSNNVKYRLNKAIQVPEHVDIKFMNDGEGLCGVCFTKRSAEEYFGKVFIRCRNLMREFPSTAEIALSPFKNSVDQDKLNEYKNLFGKSFDWQLLYKENLNVKYFHKFGIKKPYSGDFSKEEIIDLQQKCNELTSDSNLNKYYAILILDADDMGKWLSGDLAPEFKEIYHPKVWQNLPADFKKRLNGKRPVTPAIHSAISHALKNYSVEFVTKIMADEYRGNLVYCGGDDLMAFVNLEQLLNTLTLLRAAFSGHINKNFEVDFSKEASGFVEFEDLITFTMGYKATASAGICIAHYKTPLSEVLNWSRKMLSWAKDLEGKNAFAISILKHSGEIIKTRYKWFYSSNIELREGTLFILKYLINELNKGKKEKIAGFSDSFIYKIKEEFYLLSDPKVMISEDKLIKAELKRLIARSCLLTAKTENQKKERMAAIQKLTDYLYQIYLESYNFDNFMGLLEAAIFITRGGEK